VSLFLGFALTKWNPVTGQTGSEPLDAPTGFAASDDVYNSKVGLYWDTIRGANTYRIFRNDENDPATAAQIGITANSSFFDLTIEAGQSFFYWVRAENGTLASGFSLSDRGTAASGIQQGQVPPLDVPLVPPANPVTATKIYLGKALFWDEQMSSTRTVSCGTCHHSGNGGTDPRSATSSASTNPGPDLLLATPDDVRGSAGVPASNADGTYLNIATYGLGPQVTNRKTVSYINAGYSPLLFWDGRANGQFRDPVTNTIILNAGGALENQVLGPPLSTAEMAHMGRDWNHVALRISGSKPLALSPNVPRALASWINGRSYAELFDEAFGSPGVTPVRIAMAIATFERSLFSDRTPFDMAVAGISPLTMQEQRGRNIFNSPQASCSVCHAGPLFTDNSFRYIGVRPQNEDTGRFQVTGNAISRGEFRVPSLRNVELRGSFFHNGRFTTLEQVVAFYNRGGDFNAPNKPPLIRPLGLGPQQQADLVAFLKRPLTDPRVASETERFDRPALYSESDRVPQLTGSGRAGTGTIVPSIIAISPPVVGNPNFTVSVTSALGNSNAILVIDSSDPGVAAAIPTGGSLARITTSTQNTGAGNGWASVSVAIPNDNSLAGQTFFARWYIEDAGAVNGFSVSQAVRFTVFGDSRSTPQVSISGRVMTPDGIGIRNTVVTLIGIDGVPHRVTTGSFGGYLFESIPTGEAYTLTVTSKRYRFAARTLTLTGELTNVDFIGLE